LAFALVTTNALAIQQVLVVGDSLTKEYEVEFPALYTNNPASWSARNWVELLNDNRGSYFQLGTFSVYADPRTTGHEFNWAFPGATTQDIRDRLASTSFLDSLWQSTFKDQIKNTVERVVVFAGGNDIKSYYDDIYNGANGTPFINQTRDNIKWIVDYIRSQKSTIPLVLLAPPHVGCAPVVQQQFPTNATKTGRVTAALDSLNSQLAAYAQTKGIGYAANVYAMTKALIDQPFYIGGTEFYRLGDPDSRARYLFSGDGFHPNTSAQARIAQIVVDTFRAYYPSPNIPAVTDNEILGWLGVPSSTGFNEFLTTAGVASNQMGYADDPDRDGIPNLLEFLLDGMNPGQSSANLLPKPTLQTVSGQRQLVYTWKPSVQGAQFATLNLMQSSNLVNWTAVPASYVTTNADGSKTATIPASASLFLRLSATK
jgi:lysophospholipase L1-like esterase